ncbi:MAG TPA: SDR family oxidoreductase [Lentimicrobium sp.]|nr:SDR family oxidoreductase [Lentimicrobium sp.]
MESDKRFALITGASGGIGFELALIMASQKHNLILTARTGKKLENLAKQLRLKHNVTVHTFTADLAITEERNKLIQFVRSGGFTVEILVNNAGFGDLGPFAEADQEKLMRMIRLNIEALTRLSHEFLPDMLKARYGKILNVASLAGFMPGPLMSVYYASKAYVLSLSDALAHETKGTGVTITSLSPGPVITGFQEAAEFKNPALMKMMPSATAGEVAEFAYNAMMKGKKRAVHGRMHRLAVFLLRFLPVEFVTPLVSRLHQ